MEVSLNGEQIKARIMEVETDEKKRGRSSARCVVSRFDHVTSCQRASCRENGYLLRVRSIVLSDQEIKYLKQAVGPRLTISKHANIDL